MDSGAQYPQTPPELIAGTGNGWGSVRQRARDGALAFLLLASTIRWRGGRHLAGATTGG